MNTATVAKMDCPHCGQHISYEPQPEPMAGDCPACGERVVMPGENAPPAPAAAKPGRKPAAGYRRPAVVFILFALAGVLMVLGLVNIIGGSYVGSSNERAAAEASFRGTMQLGAGVATWMVACGFGLLAKIEYNTRRRE